MNAMQYKEYTGFFEFEPDDEMFHGTVVGIRDVVHFCGSSVVELKTALADSVEDYLEFCKNIGKAPEKPCSGKLMLRLSPDLHRQAETAAKASGKSLNAWMTEAIAQRLAGEAR
jgi:predicted HicB family RNase H-like nuclease